MGRYFSPKSNRAISKRDGLYVVKTKEMCTLHRTFEEAVDSYHMLYGRVPLAGPIESEKPTLILAEQPRVARISDQQALEAYKQMAETYKAQVEDFERVMRNAIGIKQTVMKEKIQRFEQRIKYAEHMSEVLVGAEEREAA